MPPKHKEVSTAAADHTGRRTRASSRAMSGSSTTASSTSSPDTSSQVESSRGKAGARTSKTSRVESTSQSPTGSRSSSSVPVSTSEDSASSSRSTTISVSSTGQNIQPASTSTTEAQNGHIRQLGPSIRVTKLTTFRPSLAGSASTSTSNSNHSTNEVGSSTASSDEVRRSNQNVPDQPVSVQDGTSTPPRQAELPQMSGQEVTSTFPRVVELGDVRVFRMGANASSNHAPQDFIDATSTPPMGAEARNEVSSPELDASVISDSDEDRSYARANISVDFSNATVDLTSPSVPRIFPTPVLRAGTARAVFRRLSESLLQQNDLEDDMGELNLTSPPMTPPHYSNFFLHNMSHPPINLADMTIDLTDSPVAAPASSQQNSLGATSAPLACEQNSPGPAPGSTSHIKCPVCLDDLPQITSTRRNLMSTTCGHVFCSSCLPLCIRSNGRCPSCRKALSPNQVHPIFL